MKDLLSGIFFDASMVTDEELTEIYKAFQNKAILLRCLSYTRSTKKDLLHEPLQMLQQKTLIIWGKNDSVTPPHIGEEFKKLIKNSELHILERCGHVPPHEHPEKCLALVENFLQVHQQGSQQTALA